VNNYVQAIVTVLSLINPLVAGAMFVQITSKESVSARVADATKAAGAILVILIMAALFGAKVLGAFGISLDAFQVAGGMVLVWIGFSMLRGVGAQSKTQGSGAGTSLTPLIIFAAGPGSIMGVITLAVNHSGTALPITALVGVTAAVAATWVVLLLGGRLAGASGHGQTLVHQVGSSFMGLIVLAMGVQFGLAGLEAFLGSG